MRPSKNLHKNHKNSKFDKKKENNFRFCTIENFFFFDKNEMDKSFFRNWFKSPKELVVLIKEKKTTLETTFHIDKEIIFDFSIVMHFESSRLRMQFEIYAFFLNLYI